MPEKYVDTEQLTRGIKFARSEDTRVLNIRDKSTTYRKKRIIISLVATCFGFTR